MSRGPRQTPAGIVYHVVNRAVARLPLFEKPADYDAYLRVLGEALDEYPMRVLAFALMPNRWHFVLWREGDRDLSIFCRWLAHTHNMRWHAHHHTSGTGHIYQGPHPAAAWPTPENSRQAGASHLLLENQVRPAASSFLLFFSRSASGVKAPVLGNTSGVRHP
jgi:putative transposase